MTIRSIVTTIARLQDPQTVAPPVEDLVEVLHGLEEVLRGPEEVLRGPEEVLQDLAKSSDPQVPYISIAGNLEEYLATHPRTKRLKDKLLKMGGKMFYADTPNDLAVSVASIHGIPEDRKPPVQKLHIVCHHMNYFSAEGIEWQPKEK